MFDKLTNCHNDLLMLRNCLDIIKIEPVEINNWNKKLPAYITARPIRINGSNVRGEHTM